jgi:hypothetical protein
MLRPAVIHEERRALACFGDVNLHAVDINEAVRHLRAVHVGKWANWTWRRHRSRERIAQISAQVADRQVVTFCSHTTAHPASKLTFDIG